MPATADIIKKNMKKEDYSCYDFRDNLEIGAFHINYLFKKYHHNYIYALAAYNAGETAVNRWKRRSSFENELWVEAIDYEETREYIRKIFQTRYFYSLFYGFDFEAAPALTN
jgi:soluble lytic murein transglycosylase